MAADLVKRPRRTEPSLEDRELAASFAKWQKLARERMGWNIPKLAHASGYSDTQVRLYDEDGYGGIDSTGRYRRPKKEYVETIGLALRLHTDKITEGLEAAGLLLNTEQVNNKPNVILEADMIPVTLSSGEVIYLRPDEPDPENTVRAIDAFLTGYRAGLKKQS